MKYTSLLLRIFLAITSSFFQVAMAQELSRPSPPQYIFHVGKRSVLSKDIVAHQIPLEDWNTYIMGEVTRFNLQPLRRGLYGTEHAALALFYGDAYIGTGEKPWLMRIEIKNSCRQPDRTSVGGQHIVSDDRFQNFFTTLANHNQLAAQCIKIDSYTHQPYFTVGLDYGNKADNVCAQTVVQFFNKFNIGVVQDEGYSQSWYIRDRNCIADITGTPDDILQMMVDRAFWSALPEEYGYNTSLVLLSQSLAEATNVNLESLGKILQAIQSIPETEHWMSGEDTWKSVVTVLKTGLRCGEKNWATYVKELRSFNDLALNPYPSKECCGDLGDKSWEAFGRFENLCLE